MTHDLTDEEFNAVLFAADQARSALCFLAQHSALESNERTQLAHCFDRLGRLQTSLEAGDQEISISSGETPLSSAALNHSG